MNSPLGTTADLALVERVQQLFDRAGPRLALSRFRVARADWNAAWREVVDWAVEELVQEGFDEAELKGAGDCLLTPKG